MAATSTPTVTPTPHINLTINVAESGDPVAAGETVTYTVTVRNTGTQTATGVLVESETSMVPITGVWRFTSDPLAQPGFTCTSRIIRSFLTLLTFITWTADAIEAGGTATLRFEITPQSPYCTPRIPWTSTVDPRQAITETNEADNRDAETTAVDDPTCPGG